MNIKKIYEYSHNGYLHKYGYEYGTYIYLTSRIQKNYYPYPTRLVDIPRWNHSSLTLKDYAYAS